MIEHTQHDEVDNLHKMLSQPIQRDDTKPRVIKESLRHIPIPSWWVDDEEASASSVRAAREMR